MAAGGVQVCIEGRPIASKIGTKSRSWRCSIMPAKTAVAGKVPNFAPLHVLHYSLRPQRLLRAQNFDEVGFRKVMKVPILGPPGCAASQNEQWQSPQCPFALPCRCIESIGSVLQIQFLERNHGSFHALYRPLSPTSRFHRSGLRNWSHLDTCRWCALYASAT
jgi:hypothetical protein